MNMNDADFIDKKNQLRRQMRRRLEQVSQSESRQAGRLIWEKILTDIFPRISEKKQSGLCVGIYYPISGEPDFLDVYRNESKYNVTCVFPVIKENNLSYYRPQSRSDFSPGPMGILQPSSKAQHVDATDIDLLLVPGLAFDKKLNRLGRGKGYYDFYLSEYDEYSKPIRVGVCHVFQLHTDIMTQTHDVKMDYIVTPEIII